MASGSKLAPVKWFFDLLYKPSPPPNLSVNELELDKLIESGLGVDSSSDEAFSRKADELYQQAPEYFVNLLNYKLKAYEEDSSHRSYWSTRVPPKAYEEAMKKMSLPALTSTGGKKALEKAIVNGDTPRIQFLYERDPNAVLNYAIEQCRKNKGNKSELGQWVSVVPIADGKRALQKVVARKDPELTAVFSTYLDSLQPGDLIDLAKNEPAFFIENLLKPFKDKVGCIQWLKDEKLRSTLEKGDQQAWDRLVKETPQLSLLEKVKDRVAKKNLTEPEDIASEVFDALISNDGISLTYYTNRLDEDCLILTGGTRASQEQRNKNIKTMNEQDTGGYPPPAKPATQCHNLLAVLRHALETCPGLVNKLKAKVKDDTPIKSNDVEGMLLTKPLKSIPGKGGLIDRSYDGNVIDDHDNFMNRILFTGNEQGKQSHTWLVIGGVPFDPVMGTTGSDVAAAVDKEFSWTVNGKVAKASGGWYVIKEGSKKAAPNSYGFGSVYRLTQDPQRYGVLAEEL